MTMVVTPFGSSETLLQSIPLFGKLFAGEREGFSTAFFEIKGPLADPKVTWIPSKSLESGITGTAKLAFDFPLGQGAAVALLRSMTRVRMQTALYVKRESLYV